MPTSSPKKTPLRDTKKKPERTPVKRAVVKRTVVKTKKTTPKRRKENVPDTDTTLTAEALVEPTDPQSVQLPLNMSQRAIEKSLVMMQEFDRYFRVPLRQITLTTAVCFMLIGSFYALVNTSIVPKGLTANTTGAVMTFPDSLLTTGTEQSIEEDTNVTAPAAVTEGSESNEPTNFTTKELLKDSTFSYIAPVPDHITKETPVTFTATNFSKLTISLYKVGTKELTELPFHLITGDKYEVIIPVNSLSNNYYRLKARVVPSDGSEPFGKISNEFFVGSADQEYAFNHADDTEVRNDTQQEVTGITIDEVVTIKKDTSGDPVKVTEEYAEAEDKRISFMLVPPVSSEVSGTITMRVMAPESATSIHLSARSRSSLDSRYITLATKRLNQWYFSFDSKNIPNGSYYFYAKTNVNGTMLTTENVELTINNKVTTPQLSSVVSGEPTEQSREVVTTASSSADLSPYKNEYISREADSLLQKNESELNALFEKYASAQQTGDETLIRLAKDTLRKKREAIILNAQGDERIKSLSDSLNEELSVRIEQLQAKIDSFEKFRKERSSGATAVDSDQDGISDVDELSLYGTDPALADTDNDGVTDGAEIMRGYDPIDPSNTVVVSFRSPKESVGLVRSDVLEVKEVTPMINEVDQSSVLTVTSEIRGRGLPNSFVTLYIFSTPTVVTIKTDADGSFVYTFDKELEDGQHDVYVAMTDNTGDIIAQSNPFTFVKTAEAYTPVAAAADAGVTPPPITEVANDGYSIAVGLGVFAFGLILLMLGVGLRRAVELNESDSQSELPAVTQ